MSTVLEVAATIPVANTGKVKLELHSSGGSIIPIPVKESIVIHPNKYEVVTVGGTPVVIAIIEYAIGAFRVTPSTHSVREARFAVYVNLSEK